MTHPGLVERWVPLSPRRAIMDHIVSTAAALPLIPCGYSMDLSELARLRRGARPRIDLPVLLIKGLALVGQRYAPLRRTFRYLPWPHLSESDALTVVLSLVRAYRGEPHIFFAPFVPHPDTPLIDLQSDFDHYRTAPVESIAPFREQLCFARMPWPVRRVLWAAMMHGPTSQRLRRVGNIGLTWMPGGNCQCHHLPGPGMVTVGYHRLQVHGPSRFLMTFDHRVIDGVHVLYGIDAMEEALRGPIAEELRSMQVGAPTARDREP